VAAPISKPYATREYPPPNKPERGLFFDPADHTALEHHMLDIVMLALGLGFFVAAVGYTYACERL
jgi:hypothetical protein